VKYHGDIDNLKSCVQSIGLNGSWVEEEANKKHTFRSQTGEILHWFYGTGTVQFQGKNQQQFLSKLESVCGGNSPLINTQQPNTPKDSLKIFIVHGHDREARDQLELVLMRLGLQPFILQNSDGGSNTIIEALEKNIYRESSFGIILMTPDDFGHPKGKEEDRQARARQNVILEMGMILAALGRSKMVILKKGVLEMPSDTDGIIRIEFNERVQEQVPKLVQRLGAAGITIDPAKIAAASA
jgi:predicted nucleotide-binding protein